jgi:agmatinase
VPAVSLARRRRLIYSGVVTGSPTAPTSGASAAAAPSSTSTSTSPSRAFDPGAAALDDAGIFGLPSTPEEARVVLVPVPWDATTSYRAGTSAGPAAIFEASMQVDLFDRENGRPYEAGIAMLPISEEVEGWNRAARASAEPIIEAGGRIDGDDEEHRALQRALGEVNEASVRVNDWVRAQVRTQLDSGKIVGIVGGDHSVPFGAIAELSERHPGLGVLHIDAHADLREAYEGFTFSHASIMHNVITRLPKVAKLVQVGIRDFSEAEATMVTASAGRIVSYYDQDLQRNRLDGEPFRSVADRIVAELPTCVYVSFDIDGLDPAMCPNTGTPVPGGLSFHEATYLLSRLVAGGKRIVGFDLNEVAPGPDSEWDANVGARLLYKIIGYTLRTQPPAG